MPLEAFTGAFGTLARGRTRQWERDKKPQVAVNLKKVDQLWLNVKLYSGTIFKKIGNCNTKYSFLLTQNMQAIQKSKKQKSV